jgi:hypothetical protein
VLASDASTEGLAAAAHQRSTPTTAAEANDRRQQILSLALASLACARFAGVRSLRWRALASLACARFAGVRSLRSRPPLSPPSFPRAQDFMKVHFSRLYGFQLCCKTAAGILCLFLYGAMTEGRVTVGLEIMVALSAILWILIGGTQAFIILRRRLDTLLLNASSFGHIIAGFEVDPVDATTNASERLAHASFFQRLRIRARTFTYLIRRTAPASTTNSSRSHRLCVEGCS